MNIKINSIDLRSRDFTATLDAGPHMDLAIAALKLGPQYAYTIQVVGSFYVSALDDGATLELDGDAYLEHPTTGGTLSFKEAGLNACAVDEALAEYAYSNYDLGLDTELAEIQACAAEAAWESYNDR